MEDSLPSMRRVDARSSLGQEELTEEQLNVDCRITHVNIISIRGSRSIKATSELRITLFLTQKHYSVIEIANLWALSEETVRRIFEREPGRDSLVYKREVAQARIVAGVSREHGISTFALDVNCTIFFYCSITTVLSIVYSGGGGGSRTI
jgi:hypothetical protein